MDIQTFYPVFESGQVLTSGRLNDIIDYLEPQDRISRASLTGIGIVCGLQPDWDGSRHLLHLSRGVAVTSAGHLFIEDAQTFDRWRRYRVPVPASPAATTRDKAEARYPFLFDGDQQLEAVELLPTDFVPAENEAAPTALTSAFVADKTLLLFLEVQLNSLKQCDINDCADKGSERTLTLRRLLVSRSVADRMLELEAEIAGRPVDRASHPRLQLESLRMEKLNPSGSGIDNLGELYNRYADCIGAALDDLQPAMRAIWQAYRPLLQADFPPQQFPQGPVPNHHLLNMLASLARNPLLIQYLYASCHDLVLACNEFIDKAAVFDGECAPDFRRFPRHVLAGDVIARPRAFSEAPRTLAEFASYEPLKITGGPAPQGQPAARRHHFVPSCALVHGQGAELRSLFRRMILLAQTFSTRQLLGLDIELTPSRDGHSELGERAIPFYYRFDSGSDLLANWSWEQARTLQIADIQSWQFTHSAAQHPFLLRQDSSDFIRIEGVLGKALGSAMAELISEKRRLGLSFSIQPVWLALGNKGDPQARQQALAAIRQLLMCRMRDLDVIFLILMAALFAFMVWLVRNLGKLNATQLIAAPQSAASPATGSETLASGLRINSGMVSDASISILALDPQETRIKLFSDQLLDLARKEQHLADNTLKLIAQGEEQAQLDQVAVASIYDKVRDQTSGGELFERVSAATSSLGIAGNRETLARTIYPSVALMARAEEMMKVTSVSSLAEFDADAFDTALRGFTDAYATYARQAETDSNRIGAAAASANKAIIERQALVSTVGTQVSSGTLGAELAKRIQSMFSDMTLPGYANKHPALEHKSGVPVGGTFVLLYAGRKQLVEGLEALAKDLQDDVGKLFSSLLEMAAPPLDIQQAIKDLIGSSRPQSDDLLDNFVVIGDLCLPYLCCDSDCNDMVVDRRLNQGAAITGEGFEVVPQRERPEQPVEPAEPAQPGQPTQPDQPVVTDERPPVEPVQPTTGRVNVLVKLPTTNVLTNRLSTINRAVLNIVDQKTNKTRTQRLTSPRTSLDLPAGRYLLFVTSPLGASSREAVTVRAGSSQNVTLTVAG